MEQETELGPARELEPVQEKEVAQLKAPVLAQELETALEGETESVQVQARVTE